MYRMPREMQCAVFENFNDLELAEAIIIDENLGLSAGYELKRRKHRLSKLYYYFLENRFLLSILYVLPNGARKEFDVRVGQGMSCSNLLNDYAAAFFYVILAYYNVSDARFQSEQEMIEDLPLEDWLGVPSEEQCRKIRTRSLDSCVKALLPWILPYRFVCDLPCKELFDGQGHLKYLDGIPFVQLLWDSDSGDIIDQLMAKFDGPKIEIPMNSVWTRESFNAVLTAHANGSGVSAPRSILCPMIDGDKFLEPEFRDNLDPLFWPMFTSWQAAHLAQFGEPKRDISHDIELDDHTYYFVLNTYSA